MQAWLGRHTPAALLVWKLRVIDSAVIPIHVGNVDLFTQIYPMQ